MEVPPSREGRSSEDDPRRLSSLEHPLSFGHRLLRPGSQSGRLRRSGRRRRVDDRQLPVLRRANEECVYGPLRRALPHLLEPLSPPFERPRVAGCDRSPLRVSRPRCRQPPLVSERVRRSPPKTLSIHPRRLEAERVEPDRIPALLDRPARELGRLADRSPRRRQDDDRASDPGPPGRCRRGRGLARVGRPSGDPDAASRLLAGGARPLLRDGRRPGGARRRPGVQCPRRRDRAAARPPAAASQPIPRAARGARRDALDVREARDPKGLYRRARAGSAPHLPGATDSYEPPLTAELVLSGTASGRERPSRAQPARRSTSGFSPPNDAAASGERVYPSTLGESRRTS